MSKCWEVQKIQTASRYITADTEALALQKAADINEWDWDQDTYIDELDAKDLEDLELTEEDFD